MTIGPCRFTRELRVAAQVDVFSTFRHEAPSNLQYNMQMHISARVRAWEMHVVMPDLVVRGMLRRVRPIGGKTQSYRRSWCRIRNEHVLYYHGR